MTQYEMTEELPGCGGIVPGVMRRLATFTISVLIALFTVACSDGGSSGSSLVNDDPYPVRILDISGIEDQVIVEEDVPVFVRDGTRLSARVFRPNKPGGYPVVMSFTSYGKDRGPEEYPPVLDFSEQPEFDMGTFEVSPWTTWEGPDPAYWVPKGYAVVYVDVRGYYDSEGKASVLSEQDRLDFHDTIEWAGTRDWSNGNVGLTGVSYLAISQWVAAGDGPPPYLKAMMPWEGQTDAYREVLYHGGVPETAFTEFWVGRVNNGANTPPLPPTEDFQTILKSPPLMRQILSRSPEQTAVAQYDPVYDTASFTVSFDRDTELTGNMKLRLWVSTSDGDDMDLFVGIKKLDAQGEEITFYAKTGYTLGPVAMGWLRVSERELDQEKSTPWQPVLTHENPQRISPNEVVPVEIEILPSSTLFREGESLQLVIQGADLFDHPSLAHEYSNEVNLGVHTIHTGGQYDSHLLIPVIP